MPGDAGHPLPGRRDGRPRGRPPRVPHDDRATGRRRRPQRRRRPRRRVRLEGGGRAGQGRARRGAAPGRAGRPQRGRPRGGDDAVPHPRPRGHRRDLGGRGHPRRRRRAWTPSAARRSPSRRRPGRRRSRCGSPGRITSATRSPWSPPRSSAVSTSTRSRSRCRTPIRPAAGGWRSTSARTGSPSSTTPTTPTPTRCAPPSTPCGRSATAPGRADGPGRSSARCSSWATCRVTEHEQVGRWAARARHRPARRRRGGATALADGAASVAETTTEVTGVADSDEAYDLLQSSCTRRRGAAQVQPRRGTALARRPAGRDRGARVKGVLIAGAVALIAALLGTPLFIRFLVKRGYGQFIRDDGPTSHHTKRGTPTMGGVVILGGGARRYFAAHLVTLQPPTVSGAARALPHDGPGGRRLPRRLHQDLQAAQPRPALEAEADRPDRRRRRLRGPGAEVPQRPVPHARLAVHLLRPRHAPQPGLRRHDRRGPAVRHLGEHHDRGHVERGEPHRRSRRAGGRRLDDGASAPTSSSASGHPTRTARPTRASSATRCATASTSPSSPRRGWAPASGSCGGTPRRPRSSWATPVRSALGGAIAGLAICTRTELLRRRPRRASSSSRSCRSSPRSSPSSSPVNGSCGWLRCITTSSWWAGTRSRS